MFQTKKRVISLYQVQVVRITHINKTFWQKRTLMSISLNTSSLQIIESFNIYFQAY